MLFTFSFNIRLKLSYLEADGIGRKSFLSIACNLKWMEEWFSRLRLVWIVVGEYKARDRLELRRKFFFSVL